MLNEVNECGTTKYLEGIGRSDPTGDSESPEEWTAVSR